VRGFAPLDPQVGKELLMNPGWELTPSLEKRTIDENGTLSETPSYICVDEENKALIETEIRIKKYRANGNPTPPGNRFFLKSRDGCLMILIHNM
jgi:hypothetical protein